MSVEQVASALQMTQNIEAEIQSLSGRDDGDTSDVMKGRCRSFADISCDIGVRFLIFSGILD